ncbi:PQQ-binding-like beta-propeller repeat protein [uncultured Brevibacillus sp.]|uniref:PQQ-binding-like beta-propeller repeat protein n=1 Tax=uncultured Brevibacillus sp. TaxID=169970 RepID=UPI002596F97B|nr:PQQ-binding-like beta-propeller repeat protein [uncultured Brevibacillus sp.]
MNIFGDVLRDHGIGMRRYFNFRELGLEGPPVAKYINTVDNHNDNTSFAVDSNLNNYVHGWLGLMTKRDKQGNYVWERKAVTPTIFGMSATNDGRLVHCMGAFGNVTACNAAGTVVAEYTLPRTEFGGSSANTGQSVLSPINGYLYWIANGYVGRINVDPAQGTVGKVWTKADANAKIFSGNRNINVVADEQDNVIYGADGNLSKRDKDGNLVWSVNNGFSALRYLTVDPSGNIYAISADGLVKKYNGTTGAVIFTKSLGYPAESIGYQNTEKEPGIIISVNIGTMTYGMDQGRLVKLDPNGNQLWQVYTPTLFMYFLVGPGTDEIYVKTGTGLNRHSQTLKFGG